MTCVTAFKKQFHDNDYLSRRRLINKKWIYYVSATLSLQANPTPRYIMGNYVVWCGVVWCGVVWCGVVWCGVVWCGVVWCGVV